jgi:hypothetical protein
MNSTALELPLGPSTVKNFDLALETVSAEFFTVSRASGKSGKTLHSGDTALEKKSAARVENLSLRTRFFHEKAGL